MEDRCGRTSSPGIRFNWATGRIYMFPRFSLPFLRRRILRSRDVSRMECLKSLNRQFNTNNFLNLNHLFTGLCGRWAIQPILAALVSCKQWGLGGNIIKSPKLPILGESKRQRATHTLEALKTKTELKEINWNKRGEEVFVEREGGQRVGRRRRTRHCRNMRSQQDEQDDLAETNEVSQWDN